ncbi:MAG: hypothetical protein N2039_08690 [Gemmataceae bacterium]|nr:hypothetical protein [Gemmataceae bacterium]
MKGLILGSAAVVMIAAATGCAGELKSGPPEGKPIPGAFHPLHVTGPDAGTKTCLV